MLQLANQDSGSRVANTLASAVTTSLASHLQANASVDLVGPESAAIRRVLRGTSVRAVRAAVDVRTEESVTMSLGTAHASLDGR